MRRVPRRSPRIEKIAWGVMQVEGYRVGKDFKLYPGGACAWDWRKTRTRHVPGIQPADVHQLLDHHASVVVLSRGMQLKLQTCPETLDLLEDEGVKIIIDESRRAAEIYNELVDEGRAVGGLFHCTC